MRRKRLKGFGSTLYGRSKITNGSRLLPSVHGKSFWARRYYDLVGLFTSDLGGDATALSEAQLALCCYASALSVELDRMTDRFAANGGADADELNTFQRSVNSLRPTIESLGTHRGRAQRDVTGGLTLGDILRADQEEERQRLAAEHDLQEAQQESEA
jgi:hypothetical protein